MRHGATGQNGLGQGFLDPRQMFAGDQQWDVGGNMNFVHHLGSARCHAAGMFEQIHRHLPAAMQGIRPTAHGKHGIALFHAPPTGREQRYLGTEQFKKPPGFLAQGHANGLACAYGQRGRLRANPQQMTGQIDHRRILVDPRFDFSIGKKYHRQSFD